jgi:hypothetical protein
MDVIPSATPHSFRPLSLFAHEAVSVSAGPCQPCQLPKTPRHRFVENLEADNWLIILHVSKAKSSGYLMWYNVV